MNSIRLIRIALKAINRNKFRTLLTMLGIIIGVGSVITMLAIGQGSKKSIQEQISAMGSNMLFIRPGEDRRGPARGPAGSVQTLTLSDVDALRNNAENINTVSPQISGGGQFFLDQRFRPDSLMDQEVFYYLAVHLLRVSARRHLAPCV